MTQTLLPLLLNVLILMLTASVVWHVLDWITRNIKNFFRHGRLQ